MSGPSSRVFSDIDSSTSGSAFPLDVLLDCDCNLAADFPVGDEEEETFCAVVPRKHTFTLAGGISTLNCGACEPECPVEAIFPEDALPEKWEPFVKINYAYGDAEKINALVNEYATEHNVQNEPIE